MSKWFWHILYTQWVCNCVWRKILILHAPGFSQEIFDIHKYSLYRVLCPVTTVNTSFWQVTNWIHTLKDNLTSESPKRIVTTVYKSPKRIVTTVYDFTVVTIRLGDSDVISDHALWWLVQSFSKDCKLLVKFTFYLI